MRPQHVELHELFRLFFGHAVALDEHFHRSYVVVNGHGLRRTSFANTDESIFKAVRQYDFTFEGLKLGNQFVACHDAYHNTDMDSLLFLADAVPVSGIGGLVVAALGGSGVAIVVVGLIARGYWEKNVAPLVKEQITRWYTDPAQVDARAKERQASIREWHDRREQVDEREKELQHFLRTPAVVEEETKRVKLIIDNEIQRSDGLIHREIKSQVTDMESRLLSKLDQMEQVMKDDNLLKQQILQEMGKLKGMMSAVMGPALTDRPKPR